MGSFVFFFFDVYEVSGKSTVKVTFCRNCGERDTEVGNVEISRVEIGVVVQMIAKLLASGGQLANSIERSVSNFYK